MTLSFNDYDLLLECFEKIKQKTAYWPDPNAMALMEQNPDKYVLFACYLYEMNDAPRTAAEKYSRKNLSGFINSNLVLTETGARLPAGNEVRKLLESLREEKKKNAK